MKIKDDFSQDAKIFGIASTK